MTKRLHNEEMDLHEVCCEHAEHVNICNHLNYLQEL